jgi:hypothetical protein
MNENQQKVYHWLVVTCGLEDSCVADVTRHIWQLADTDTLTAYTKLTPVQRDEALYQAIVEVDGEKVF